MNGGYHVVVCGSLVPDPLQTLQPVMGPDGPGLRNEMMLPAVLDPWAAHALFEAAHLVKQQPGSKLWWVCLGPKSKLQQLLMSIGQKAPFDLIALDGPSGGFVESWDTAAHIADGIQSISALDHSRLLLFGGWESASRTSGSTLQMVGERLGITDQFQGVDQLTIRDDGHFEILERVEGGKHQVSVCPSPPMLVGWATGNLPEPSNNPQVGMANMRNIMPALQKARPVQMSSTDVRFLEVTTPQQKRETRIVRDVPAETIAREVIDWIRGS